ncbi:MAG: DUF362 domain-containing protein [Deltaproteobacteria bacterium]|nr:DUF362 domain-containing protein [Deltaproteobacteria bacterium]
MSRVTIREATYDYETLRPLIYESLEAFCGDIITPSSRVVIKPNLLRAAPPESAVLTHPLIVRAVAQYVIDKGARPQISDSQAIGSFSSILAKSGVRAALDGLEVDIREFKRSVKTDIGPPFGEIDIAGDAVEADILINLAKLKTHGQMLLTCGVKNLFGCVVGFRKPEWHMRAGVDRDLFARLIVSIYHTLAPTVTIVDGILALEGDGPGKGGTPRQVGYLIAGRDAVAVDRVICSMLGIDPRDLPSDRASVEMGIGGEAIEIDGTVPRIEGFQLPENTPLTYGPRRLQSAARRWLLERPVVDETKCKMCGECLEFCPADAIQSSDEKIIFDYEKCIRCYCCMEICPHGALHSKTTLPGRLLERILHKE